MTDFAAFVRDMTAAGAPAEAIAIAIAAVQDAEAHDHRTYERERKREQRARAKADVPEVSGTSPGQVRDTPFPSSEVPPTPPSYPSNPIPVPPIVPQSKAKAEPEGFVLAWKAYPHVKGRSSRSKALAAWKRLPLATREALPAAAARYSREGREPKEECGAPAMERWLANERFTDWLSGPTVAVLTWRGPPEVRAAVVAKMGEDATRSYLDPCAWRDVPERAVVSTNGHRIDRLRREVGPALAELGVKVLCDPLARAV